MVDFTGSGSNDTISGTSGDDTIEGRGGNDALYGGAGNDKFVFAEGDGQDYIGVQDGTSADQDTIEITGPLTINDVWFERTTSYDPWYGYINQDLVIHYGSSGDTITLGGQMRNDWFGTTGFNAVRTLTIGGISYSLTEALNLRGTESGDILYATAGSDTIHGLGSNDTIYAYGGDDQAYGDGGNDVIHGYEGDDTLTGGVGDDALYGGAGNDQFVFTLGDGHDYVDVQNAGTGDQDRIVLNGALTINDVWFERTTGYDYYYGYIYQDLVIHYGAAGDTITLHGQFKNQLLNSTGYNEIRTLVINGVEYNLTDALNLRGGEGGDSMLGSSGNDTLMGFGGNDSLYGYAGNDIEEGADGNDIIYGHEGEDTIDGGTGNDALYGGEGNDHFVFTLGDGQDYIDVQNYGSGDQDTIEITGALTIDDVWFERTQSYDYYYGYVYHDLVIHYGTAGDTITLNAQFRNQQYGSTGHNEIRTLIINGVSYSLTDALNLRGTEGSELVQGAKGNDTLDALGGNDTLYGYEGDDTEQAGAGNDVIHGHQGEDTIDGGSGNDALYGGEGNDHFVFTLGDGQDYIDVQNYGSGDQDTIEIDGALTIDDVWFERTQSYDYYYGYVYQDLVIHYGTAGDTITLASQFRNQQYGSTGYNEIRTLIINGISYSLTDALNLRGTEGSELIQGAAGNDTLEALGGNDTVYGYDGNDIARGGAGNDALYGHEAEDTLTGGTGNDALYGGTGNDRFVFSLGDGQDYIGVQDAALGDQDVIEILGALTINDVWFERTQSYDYYYGYVYQDLVIHYGPNGDTITLGAQFKNDVYGSTGYARINTLVVGGVAYDLNDGLLIRGTPDSESVYATTGNDVVQGLDGNDTLYALAGDDTLEGGLGSDYLVGGDGIDVARFDGQESDYTIVVDGSVTYVTDNREHSPNGTDTLSGIEIIQFEEQDASTGSVTRIGTSGADSLTGGEYADTILGYEGNDTLTGLGGNDLIYAGEDDDTVDAGTGADTIYGGAGADNLTAGDGNDYVSDLDSRSTVTGGAGDDSIYAAGDIDGGDGNDSIDATSVSGITTADTLTGGAGNDTIRASSGNTDGSINTIDGGAGNDEIYGGANGDSIVGGDGDDYLVDGYARSTISGGAGNDSIWASGVIDAGDGSDYVDSAYFSASSQGDSIVGGEGNDTIYGNTANADSANTLEGGAGDDLLRGSQFADSIDGGTGDDDIAAGAGNDTIDGGDGLDIIRIDGNRADFTLTRDPVTGHIVLVDNRDGSPHGTDTLDHVEIVRFNDQDVTYDGRVITGTIDPDTLYGSDANDTITALDGDDTVYGNGGHDSIDAGAGVDSLYGGVGNDSIDGGEDNDFLDGSVGDNSLIGGGGNDIVYAEDGSDTIDGGAGNDWLWGSSGRNVVSGGDGNDTLLGAGTLDGGDGDDYLNTQNYWYAPTNVSEHLIGGAGNDTLVGNQSNTDGGANTLEGGSGNDQIVGGSYADSMLGGEGDDSFTGYGGNDTIDGGDDLDIVYVNGSRADFTVTEDSVSGVITLTANSPELNYGSNILTNIEVIRFNDQDISYSGLNLTGTNDPDTINGSAAKDTITALDDNDHVYGYGGADLIVAGGGDDYVEAGTGNDTVTGGTGNDTVYGYAGNDSLTGDDGNDWLWDNEGRNTLSGGEGNDTLLGSGTLDGGVGDDYLDTNNYWSGASITGEHLLGGEGNDTLVGNQTNTDGTANTLEGGEGGDDIYGGNQADLIDGGAGNDVMRGYGGNDTIEGGDGADVVYVTGNREDYSIDVDGVTGAVTLTDLRAGSPNGTDVLTHVEILGFDDGFVSLSGNTGSLITGTPFSEVLDGTYGDDTINGLDGGDVVNGGIGNDVIDGGDGQDTLYGDDSDDTVSGGEGHDYVLGGQGHDVLDGGTGDDTVYGGEGNDTSNGGDGQDHVYGQSGNDSLAGNDGDDVLDDSDGWNSLSGGEGSDTLSGTGTLSGGKDDDRITVLAGTGSGDAGNDHLIGSGGAETLLGGAGNDKLEALAGADSLSGGDGNDILIGDAGLDGDDTIDGGAGYDVAYYTGTPADYTIVTDAFGVTTITDNRAGAPEGSDTLTNVELLIIGDQEVYLTPNTTGSLIMGTSADDQIPGAGPFVNTDVNGSDTIDALSGFDHVAAGGGDDVVLGRIGNDVLDGQYGNDTLVGGSGDDTLLGSTGEDVLYGSDGPGDNADGNGDGNPDFDRDSLDGGANNDTLIGGNGEDRLTDSQGTNHLYGGDDNDTLIGTGTLEGGDDNDNISGSGILLGQAGDDIIDGTGTLDGGTGNDVLYVLTGATGQGSDGNDALYGYNPYGYDGAQTLSGGEGDDAISGNYGDDLISGDAGNDVLDGGYGSDTVEGGEGNDTLSDIDGNGSLDGGAGNDSLLGGYGSDTLIGGTGHDTITARLGDDSISAGSGDDMITSGEGNDTVDGGEGYDVAALTGDRALYSVVSDGAGGYYVVNNRGADGQDHITAVEVARFANTDLVLGTAVAGDILTGNADNATLVGTGFDDSLIGGSGLEVLAGNTGNDIIEGGAGADTLDGGIGFDVLNGGADNDLLLGGDGDDTLDGGLSGNDTLDGGTGNDLMTGGSGNDSLLGGDGNDAIDGGSGTDTVDGGTGNDIITGHGSLHGGNDADSITGSGALFGDDGNDVLISSTNGADTLEGGAGNDTLYVYNGAGLGGAGDDTLLGYNPATGGSGSENLDGGTGSDVIYGYGGADTLIGGQNDDTLVGGAGNDLVYGGSGDDRAYFTGNIGTHTTTIDETGHVRIESSDYIVTYQVDEDGFVVDGAVVYDKRGVDGQDVVYGVETLVFADTELTLRPYTNVGLTFTGTAGDDILVGDLGNDTLTGLVGNDRLSGDAGDDVLNGNDGNDVLNGDTGADTLSGGDGLDHIYGGEGSDSLLGGADDDTIDGAHGTDTIYGEGGNDVIDAGSGDDVVFGDEGNDTIYGSTGANTIDGGAGNDYITVAEASSVDGGTGNDYLWGDGTLSGGADNDTIYAWTLGKGDGGDDVIAVVSGGTGQGGDGNDTLIGWSPYYYVDGNQTLEGGNGNDVIVGNYGADVLKGDADNDALSGGMDNDTLDGGTGNDTLTGGQGDDSLTGGDGLDQATYGSLRDHYSVVADGAGGYIVVANRSDEGQDALSGIEEASFSDQTVTIDQAHAGTIVTGSSGDNTLTGGANDDSINGLGGNDEIYADDGNDIIRAGAGHDYVEAGAGFDVVHGDAGDDYVLSGDGEDQVFGESGNDTLSGEGGNDTVSDSDGYNSLYGEDGDDVITGTGEIYGGSGNDTIDATGYVLGEDGNDVIHVYGSTASYGGEGDDVISQVWPYDSDQWMSGDAGNDTLISGNGSDTLFGGEGEDVLSAGNGDDSLEGGIGNDTLSAGNGYDVLKGGEGDDALNGGEGDDRLEGGLGADTFSGGGGNDKMFGGGASAANPDVAYYDGNRNDYTVVELDGKIVVTDNRAGSPNGTDTLYGIYTLVFADGDYQGTPNYGYTYHGGDNADIISDHSSAEVTSDRPGAPNTSSGDDTIYGHGGDDVIFGLAGAEQIYGGTGNDSVYGGSEPDAIYGEVGDDYLDGGDEDDLISGGDDNDVILGGGGEDALSGDAGNDYIDGGSEDDAIDGGSGNDTLMGGLGGDTIRGGDDADTITDTSGANQISGGDGDDVIAASGTAHGDEGKDTLTGSLGDDALYGDGGDDTLSDASGHNTLSGGSGDDHLTGSGVLDGGEGNDTFRGSAASDSFIGGDGDDVLVVAGNRDDYSIVALPAGGFALIGHGDHVVDTLTGIETIVFDDVTVNPIMGGEVVAGTVGTSLDDSITGTSGDDDVSAGNGHDLIWGGSGNDSIDAGYGNDYALGEGGADRIDGGQGNDTLAGGAAADTLNGGSDNDLLSGDDGDDVLHGDAGNDNLEGGFGNDNLYGDAGNDTLSGGNNDDTLDGGTGDDVLDGGQGNDTLLGGDDNDSLTDSSGTNTLDGGDGNDTLTGTGTLSGGTGDDTLTVLAGSGSGGTGDDHLSGSVNAVTLDGNDGLDSINGGSGNDTLNGGSDADTITGGAGDDTIDGGTGNDHLTGNAGNDSLTGGEGSDTAHYANNRDQYTIASDGNGGYVVVDNFPENGNEGTDHLGGVEYLAFADQTIDLATAHIGIIREGDQIDNNLTGTTENDTLRGFGGNDTLSGEDGNDLLIGDDGNDHLDGGNGADRLDGGSAADIMHGGAGADIYYVDDAGDVVDDSVDNLVDDGAVDTVIADISYTLGDRIENLTLKGISPINGTGNALDNVLAGNLANNTLDGGEGTDRAVYTGLRSDYTITEVADGFTITDNRPGSPDGTDHLINIEEVQFGDQVLALVPTGNHAPVADASQPTINEDAVLHGTVSASDSDGDSLTYAMVTGPQHGTLEFHADGTYVYTPTGNYNGPDSFTFKANDGTADSAPASVSLTINPVNDAPTASASAPSLNEDAVLHGTVSGADIDGDQLTYAMASGPQHGTLEFHADGTYVYTPTGNYNGPDSFTFTANDGTVSSAPATVSLTVNPVNDAPTANASAPSLNEDAALHGTVSGADIDGDALTYAMATGPQHGTLEFHADGTYVYTPTGNYNGPDSFTFTSSDGTVSSAPATVSLTVNPVNDAPTASASAPSVNEDAVLHGTVSGADIDGDQLTYAMATGPQHGTLEFHADGTYVYTPTGNYNGPDSFTFTANDGTVSSAPATVSLMVNPVNDAPTANASAPSLNEDAVLHGTVSGADIDGDALTYAMATGPQHGTLEFHADGTYVYTPTGNYNGLDTFTFTANDGTATSAPATVSLTVSPVNDAPTANASAPSLNEDAVLNGTVSGADIDGDALTYALATGPAHGTLVFHADGTYSYAPTGNYNGPDSFTFTSNDGTATSAPATVSLTINPVNDAPVTQADSYTTNEDQPLVVQVASGLLANDSDVDLDALTAAVATGPAHGSVTVNADGSFVYTPVANYNGADSFTYTVSDGNVTSPPATVSLTVTAVNDAPTANASAASLNEDAVLNGAVSGADIDGNSLTYTLATGPAHGTLTFNGDGTYVYTPAANYNGSDSFTFTVNDGTVSSAAATVSLTIASVNDAPVGGNDTATVLAVGPRTITLSSASLLANDSDIDGGALSIVSVGTAAHGTLVLNTNGTPANASDDFIIYTPATGYAGSDSFTYTLSDGTTTATATVNVTVQAASTPASTYTLGTSGNDVIDKSGQAGVQLISGVAGNDTLTGGSAGDTLNGGDGNDTLNGGQGADTLTGGTGADVFVIAKADMASGVDKIGDFTGAGNGAVAGDDVIQLTGFGAGATLTKISDVGTAHTYRVTDGAFTGTFVAVYSGNATLVAGDYVFVASGPANTAPLAGTDNATVNQGASVTITTASLLANDSDADSNPLSITAVGGATTGTVTLNTNGTATTADDFVVFTPAAGFSGAASFTYTLSDTFTTSTGTVNVTVAPSAPNNLPVAGDDTYSTNEDTTLNGSTVLVNDSDADAQALTAILVSGPAHGSLTLNANGTFTYTPVANYSGTDSFTYKASDGLGSSNTATVNLTVNPINDAPVAGADAVTVLSTGPRTITINVATLLANDTDADGNALTITGVTAAPHGTVTFSDNGTTTTADDTVTYSPTTGYAGADSFGYIVSDGTTTANGTVNVTVQAEATAPTYTGGTSGNDTYDFSSRTNVQTVAGNGGNDVITTGSAADTINGGAGDDTIKGGTGKDTLTGGAGLDTFVFASADADKVVDFVVADDTFALVKATFGALTEQNATDHILLTSQFAIGAAATNVDQRVIYNAATGALYYDADGSGAGAMVQIALLTKNLALTHDDFVVWG